MPAEERADEVETVDLADVEPARARPVDADNCSDEAAGPDIERGVVSSRDWKEPEEFRFFFGCSRALRLPTFSENLALSFAFLLL